jgi:hypothetical protein
MGLPGFLKTWWLCVSPFAILFAGRVLWEKTVWTWARGPQMVGFSLMHIHPMFAVVGVLSCLGTMTWMLPAIPYAIIRRKEIGLADAAMIACATLVTLIIVLPDNIFAR